MFFTIQDNGTPGKNRDDLSGAYFWDGDPNTQGPPSACLNSTTDDEPLGGPIVHGNFTIREID